MSTYLPADALITTTALPSPSEDTTPLLLGPTVLRDLLQRIALHQATSEPATALGLEHLCAALAYTQPADPDIERSMARLLKGRTLPSPATAQQRRALCLQRPLQTPLPCDSALDAYLLMASRRYPQGFLAWRDGQPLASTNWFETLYSALVAQLPGQQEAAEALARHLALQLDEPDRPGAAHVLLIGPAGSGCRQAARAVARALSTWAGYGEFEFDMGLIRSAGEVTELDGGNPQWSGARPGRLTSALHKLPRTVVVLHDVDQAVADAQRPLLSALQQGDMEDQYGLDDNGPRRPGEGRQPTTVDMSQAIFITTASSGQDFWQHPDMAEMLDSQNLDWREAHHCALLGLRHAEREYRGEKIPALHPHVLDVLEPHAVVFRPLSWAHLRSGAEQAVLEACRKAATKLRIPVLVEPGKLGGLSDVALTWLAGLGHRVGLEQLSPARAELTLLTTLAQAVIAAQPEGQHPEQARIQLASSETETLHSLMAAMGPEPQRQMARRRCHLRFDVQVQAVPPSTTQPAHWLIELKGLRWQKVRDHADYTGATALSAVVPEVSFDEVAGHDAVKAELRNIIKLYNRADELRQRGLVLPRGAVLHGPPGTGKTLLAQATAAAADMAFVSTTGADLLNPETVKQVFRLAQRNAPAMVFIDEIDVLGKRGRGSSVVDAAVNRLLTFIQGFDQRAPVFVLAATNRLHLLDDALLRPGRLDKKLYVGALDRAGREPLLRRLITHLHPEARDEASLQRLLSFSEGMTGADLGEVLRHVGLHELNAHPATGGTASMSLAQALELIISRRLGEKSQQQCDPAFRELIAHHEAGHAVALAALRPELKIQQVSIVGREQLQGHMSINAEDRLQREATAASRLKEMAVLLAGREAERLRYPAEGPSEGGAQDLVQARVIAFMSVAHRGLDEGPEGFAGFTVLSADDEDRSLWPESLKQHLWGRVRLWMQRAQDMAQQTLRDHWPAVQQVTQELLAHDVLPGERIQAILALHPASGGQPGGTPELQNPNAAPQR
jgi:cell division protease FtsH